MRAHVKPSDTSFSSDHASRTGAFRFPKLSSATVLAIILIYYTSMISGVIYDIVMNPPAYTFEMSDSGSYRVVMFRRGLSSQFILEGLTFGIVCLIGGICFIMSDVVDSARMSERQKFWMWFASAVCGSISLSLVSVFMQIKMGH